MKILVTGASGFLGKVICRCLADETLIRLGRGEGEVVADLTKPLPPLPLCDLVVHAAGLAHVIPDKEEVKKAFFDVNVQGTENLLKGLSALPVLPKYMVLISSVAVYGLETGTAIPETAPLLAQDAYGKSKIEAEVRVRNWCSANHVICTILRLPLVFGEEPKGNLAAMWKGIRKGYYFNVGGGKARRSMVLAEDVARTIPIVAPLGGTYHLTDGDHPVFGELSLAMSQRLGRSKPLNLPAGLALLFAQLGNLMGASAPINSRKLQKITSDLTFDDGLARERFGWNPGKILDYLSKE